MANTAGCTLRGMARQAKLRMKSGFWAECEEEKVERLKRAEEAGLNTGEAGRYFHSEMEKTRTRGNRRRVLRKGERNAFEKRRSQRRNRASDRPRRIRQALVRGKATLYVRFKRKILARVRTLQARVRV